jgi:O-glycosyl hydrolase
VASRKRGDDVEVAAFFNPDGSRAAILHRKSGDDPITVALDGVRYEMKLPNGSVATVLWGPRPRAQ